MNRLLFIVSLLLVAFPPLLRAAEPRVLIVSIDGLRPDLSMRAKMPNLRSLMEDGSFSLWTYTTPAAVTLPSHTSMLTGVTIERHGIRGNDEKAAATETLLVPTIFDLAKKAGISTGMAAGKAKFILYLPSIDHGWVSKNTTTNVEVGDHAVDIIRKHKPRLMFVHLPQVDSAGHKFGWGTREQIDAIEDADKHLGRVLDALREEKLFDETTIILSADHGGSGKTHGKDDDRSRFIPWIIRGPGVLKNVDLTQFRDLKVQTYDTFATACDVLKLPTPEGIDGKVITQAFAATDLMGDTSPTTPPTTQPASARGNSRGHDFEGQIVLYADGYVDWSEIAASATQPTKRSGSNNHDIDGGDIVHTDGPAEFSETKVPATQSTTLQHGFRFNAVIDPGFDVWSDIGPGRPASAPTTQPQTPSPKP